MEVEGLQAVGGLKALEEVRGVDGEGVSFEHHQVVPVVSGAELEDDILGEAEDRMRRGPSGIARLEAPHLRRIVRRPLVVADALDGSLESTLVRGIARVAGPRLPVELALVLVVAGPEAQGA